ncbi:MAG: DsrE family protein [Pseudomonadota bacterium]
MKKMLVIFSTPPYQNSHTVEMLEAAMVGAVFDFQVSLLFRDQGVWCLQNEQNAVSLGRRTVGKVLQAMPAYDVSAIYACAPSVNAAHLDPSRLKPLPQLLEHSAQAILLAEQHFVLSA